MHRIVRAAVATASGVALTFTVTMATQMPADALSKVVSPAQVTDYHGSVTTHAATPTARSKPAVARSKSVVALSTPIVAHAASSKVSASSRGAKAVAFARRQLGDRYRFGAAGPNSWDCSGLTMGAWRSAGVRLPHSAKQQFHRGRKVSRSSLRPGDLVFFYRGIKHVAIYAGGGKVIHAPRPGKRVQYIKVSSMPYQGARRVG